MSGTLNRLCAVAVDHDQVRPSHEVEIEQETAIADLLEESCFELVGRQQAGPYRLVISTHGSRFTFHVAGADGVHIVSHFMSAGPLHRLIRAYVAICEAHYEAAAKGDAQRLEAIDMGRRATHNEASELLRDRLSTKVRTDLETARRLFTIIAACRMGNPYGPALGLMYYDGQQARTGPRSAG
ncbi:UPF0262 family protein [Rhizobium sp. CF142]|uniref:UPF0262 family protein n=1 Tax=Rhizobium sp. CF142 TaxID=1144314 RepID=UPI00026F050E|nr:UPF0262 family protein [Rhizobium sp. CF142]EJJ25583.1 hypothetical protein PMI11_06201 [Rhizobium sp. CF142]